MRHVDLCSGIGGFALGFQWAGLSNPVLFCDIEPWSRQVLKKHWPDVPIAEDVKELANDPDGLIPDCDIITAGYPCQPFSVAGQRRGAEDDRHIWPHIFSIIQRKRPSWCVFENVYGHVSMGLDEVLSDLEGEGYATRPFIIPACAVDALHRRDRVWIISRNLANSDNARQSASQGDGKDCRDKQGNNTRRSGQNVADINGDRRKREWSKRNNTGSLRLCGGETERQACFWKPEPAVGRVANGIPKRVDRLRGLGNAIVPQIAQKIGETIKFVEYGE